VTLIATTIAASESAAVPADVIPLVLGVVGVVFGLAGSLLAWSFSRNVNEADRRISMLEARCEGHSVAISGVRVELADCVRRTTFDEVNAKIGSLDVKIERLLTLVGDKPR
jgi:hypothetical protein